MSFLGKQELSGQVSNALPLLLGREMGRYLLNAVASPGKVPSLEEQGTTDNWSSLQSPFSVNHRNEVVSLTKLVAGLPDVNTGPAEDVHNHVQAAVFARSLQHSERKSSRQWLPAPPEEKQSIVSTLLTQNLLCMQENPELGVRFLKMFGELVQAKMPFSVNLEDSERIYFDRMIDICRKFMKEESKDSSIEEQRKSLLVRENALRFFLSVGTTSRILDAVLFLMEVDPKLQANLQVRQLLLFFTGALEVATRCGTRVRQSSVISELPYQANSAQLVITYRDLPKELMPSKLKAGRRWDWECDVSWEHYSNKIAAILEEAYEEGRTTADFRHPQSGCMMRVDLTRMVQRNLTTGNERAVRSVLSLLIRERSGRIAQTVDINMHPDTLMKELRTELANYLKHHESQLRMMYKSRVLYRDQAQHLTIRQAMLPLSKEPIVVMKLSSGELEHLCTCVDHGPVPTKQPMYMCLSCGILGGAKGYLCRWCVLNCHLHHQTVAVSGEKPIRGVCSCGLGGSSASAVSINSRCRALPFDVARKQQYQLSSMCVGPNGHYLYQLSAEFGLMKLGTGKGGTMGGKVYAQNMQLSAHAGGHMAVVPGGGLTADGDELCEFLLLRSPLLGHDVLQCVDTESLQLLNHRIDLAAGRSDTLESAKGASLLETQRSDWHCVSKIQEQSILQSVFGGPHKPAVPMGSKKLRTAGYIGVPLELENRLKTALLSNWETGSTVRAPPFLSTDAYSGSVYFTAEGKLKPGAPAPLQKLFAAHSASASHRSSSTGEASEEGPSSPAQPEHKQSAGEAKESASSSSDAPLPELEWSSRMPSARIRPRLALHPDMYVHMEGGGIFLTGVQSEKDSSDSDPERYSRRVYAGSGVTEPVLPIFTAGDQLVVISTRSVSELSNREKDPRYMHTNKDVRMQMEFFDLPRIIKPAAGKDGRPQEEVKEETDQKNQNMLSNYVFCSRCGRTVFRDAHPASIPSAFVSQRWQRYRYGKDRHLVFGENWDMLDPQQFKSLAQNKFYRGCPMCDLTFPLDDSEVKNQATDDADGDGSSSDSSGDGDDGSEKGRRTQVRSQRFSADGWPASRPRIAGYDHSSHESGGPLDSSAATNLGQVMSRSSADGDAQGASLSSSGLTATGNLIVSQHGHGTRIDSSGGMLPCSPEPLSTPPHVPSRLGSSQARSGSGDYGPYPGYGYNQSMVGNGPISIGTDGNESSNGPPPPRRESPGTSMSTAPRSRSADDNRSTPMSLATPFLRYLQLLSDHSEDASGESAQESLRSAMRSFGGSTRGGGPFSGVSRRHRPFRQSTTASSSDEPSAPNTNLRNTSTVVSHQPRANSLHDGNYRHSRGVDQNQVHGSFQFSAPNDSEDGDNDMSSGSESDSSVEPLNMSDSTYSRQALAPPQQGDNDRDPAPMSNPWNWEHSQNTGNHWRESQDDLMQQGWNRLDNLPFGDGSGSVLAENQDDDQAMQRLGTTEEVLQSLQDSVLQIQELPVPQPYERGAGEPSEPDVFHYEAWQANSGGYERGDAVDVPSGGAGYERHLEAVGLSESDSEVFADPPPPPPRPPRGNSDETLNDVLLRMLEPYRRAGAPDLQGALPMRLFNRVAMRGGLPEDLQVVQMLRNSFANHAIEMKKRQRIDLSSCKPVPPEYGGLGLMWVHAAKRRRVQPLDLTMEHPMGLFPVMGMGNNVRNSPKLYQEFLKPQKHLPCLGVDECKQEDSVSPASPTATGGLLAPNTLKACKDKLSSLLRSQQSYFSRCVCDGCGRTPLALVDELLWHMCSCEKDGSTQCPVPWGSVGMLSCLHRGCDSLHLCKRCCLERNFNSSSHNQSHTMREIPLLVIDKLRADYDAAVERLRDASTSPDSAKSPNSPLGQFFASKPRKQLQSTSSNPCLLHEVLVQTAPCWLAAPPPLVAGRFSCMYDELRGTISFVRVPFRYLNARHVLGNFQHRSCDVSDFFGSSRLDHAGSIIADVRTGRVLSRETVLKTRAHHFVHDASSNCIWSCGARQFHRLDRWELPRLPFLFGDDRTSPLTPVIGTHSVDSLGACILFASRITVLPCSDHLLMGMLKQLETGLYTLYKAVLPKSDTGKFSSPAQLRAVEEKDVTRVAQVFSGRVGELGMQFLRITALALKKLHQVTSTPPQKQVNSRHGDASKSASQTDVVARRSPQPGSAGSPATTRGDIFDEDNKESTRARTPAAAKELFFSIWDGMTCLLKVIGGLREHTRAYVGLGQETHHLLWQHESLICDVLSSGMPFFHSEWRSLSKLWLSMVRSTESQAVPSLGSALPRNSPVNHLLASVTRHRKKHGTASCTESVCAWLNLYDSVQVPTNHPRASLFHRITDNVYQTVDSGAVSEPEEESCSRGSADANRWWKAHLLFKCSLQLEQRFTGWGLSLLSVASPEKAARASILQEGTAQNLKEIFNRVALFDMKAVHCELAKLLLDKKPSDSPKTGAQTPGESVSTGKGKLKYHPATMFALEYQLNLAVTLNKAIADFVDQAGEHAILSKPHAADSVVASWTAEFESPQVRTPSPADDVERSAAVNSAGQSGLSMVFNEGEDRSLKNLLTILSTGFQHLSQSIVWVFVYCEQLLETVVKALKEIRMAMNTTEVTALFGGVTPNEQCMVIFNSTGLAQLLPWSVLMLYHLPVRHIPRKVVTSLFARASRLLCLLHSLVSARPLDTTQQTLLAATQPVLLRSQLRKLCQTGWLLRPGVKSRAGVSKEFTPDPKGPTDETDCSMHPEQKIQKLSRTARETFTILFHQFTRVDWNKYQDPSAVAQMLWSEKGYGSLDSDNFIESASKSVVSARAERARSGWEGRQSSPSVPAWSSTANVNRSQGVVVMTRMQFRNMLVLCGVPSSSLSRIVEYALLRYGLRSCESVGGWTKLISLRGFLTFWSDLCVQNPTACVSYIRCLLASVALPSCRCPAFRVISDLQVALQRCLKGAMVLSGGFASDLSGGQDRGGADSGNPLVDAVLVAPQVSRNSEEVPLFPHIHLLQNLRLNGGKKSGTTPAGGSVQGSGISVLLAKAFGSPPAGGVGTDGDVSARETPGASNSVHSGLMSRLDEVEAEAVMKLMQSQDLLHAHPMCQEAHGFLVDFLMYDPTTEEKDDDDDEDEYPYDGSPRSRVSASAQNDSPARLFARLLHQCMKELGGRYYIDLLNETLENEGFSFGTVERAVTAAILVHCRLLPSAVSFSRSIAIMRLLQMVETKNVRCLFQSMCPEWLKTLAKTVGRLLRQPVVSMLRDYEDRIEVLKQQVASAVSDSGVVREPSAPQQAGNAGNEVNEEKPLPSPSRVTAPKLDPVPAKLVSILSASLRNALFLSLGFSEPKHSKGATASTASVGGVPARVPGGGLGRSRSSGRARLRQLDWLSVWKVVSGAAPEDYVTVTAADGKFTEPSSGALPSPSRPPAPIKGRKLLLEDPNSVDEAGSPGCSSSEADDEDRLPWGSGSQQASISNLRLRRVQTDALRPAHGAAKELKVDDGSSLMPPELGVSGLGQDGTPRKGVSRQGMRQSQFSRPRDILNRVHPTRRGRTGLDQGYIAGGDNSDSSDAESGGGISREGTGRRNSDPDVRSPMARTAPAPGDAPNATTQTDAVARSTRLTPRSRADPSPFTMRAWNAMDDKSPLSSWTGMGGDSSGGPSVSTEEFSVAKAIQATSECDWLVGLLLSGRPIHDRVDTMIGSMESGLQFRVNVLKEINFLFSNNFGQEVLDSEVLSVVVRSGVIRDLRMSLSLRSHAPSADNTLLFLLKNVGRYLDMLSVGSPRFFESATVLLQVIGSFKELQSHECDLILGAGLLPVLLRFSRLLDEAMRSASCGGSSNAKLHSDSHALFSNRMRSCSLGVTVDEEFLRSAHQLQTWTWKTFVYMCFFVLKQTSPAKRKQHTHLLAACVSYSLVSRLKSHLSAVSAYMRKRSDSSSKKGGKQQRSSFHTDMWPLNVHSKEFPQLQFLDSFISRAIDILVILKELCALRHAVLAIHDCAFLLDLIGSTKNPLPVYLQQWIIRLLDNALANKPAVQGKVNLANKLLAAYSRLCVPYRSIAGEVSRSATAGLSLLRDTNEKIRRQAAEGPPITDTSEGKLSTSADSITLTVDGNDTVVLSKEEKTKLSEDYTLVGVLVCPNCRFLEFPACGSHNELLTRPKGNKEVAKCPGRNCSTSSDDKFWAVCRHCKSCKPAICWWLISVNDAHVLFANMDALMGAFVYKNIPQCSHCHAVSFEGLFESKLCDRLMCDLHNRPPRMRDESKFKHAFPRCKGTLRNVLCMVTHDEALCLRRYISSSAGVDVEVLAGYLKGHFEVLHRRYIAATGVNQGHSLLAWGYENWAVTAADTKMLRSMLLRSIRGLLTLKGTSGPGKRRGIPRTPHMNRQATIDLPQSSLAEADLRVRSVSPMPAPGRGRSRGQSVETYHESPLTPQVNRSRKRGLQMRFPSHRAHRKSWGDVLQMAVRRSFMKLPKLLTQLAELMFEKNSGNISLDGDLSNALSEDQTNNSAGSSGRKSDSGGPSTSESGGETREVRKTTHRAYRGKGRGGKPRFRSRCRSKGPRAVILEFAEQLSLAQCAVDILGGNREPLYPGAWVAVQKDSNVQSSVVMFKSARSSTQEESDDIGGGSSSSPVSGGAPSPGSVPMSSSAGNAGGSQISIVSHGSADHLPVWVPSADGMTSHSTVPDGTIRFSQTTHPVEAGVVRAYNPDVPIVSVSLDRGRNNPFAGKEKKAEEFTSTELEVPASRVVALPQRPPLTLKSVGLRLEMEFWPVIMESLRLLIPVDGRLGWQSEQPLQQQLVLPTEVILGSSYYYIRDKKVIGPVAYDKFKSSQRKYSVDGFWIEACGDKWMDIDDVPSLKKVLGTKLRSSSSSFKESKVPTPPPVEFDEKTGKRIRTKPIKNLGASLDREDSSTAKYLGLLAYLGLYLQNALLNMVRMQLFPLYTNSTVSDPFACFPVMRLFEFDALNCENNYDFIDPDAGTAGANLPALLRFCVRSPNRLREFIHVMRQLGQVRDASLQEMAARGLLGTGSIPRLPSMRFFRFRNEFLLQRDACENALLDYAAARSRYGQSVCLPYNYADGVVVPGRGTKQPAPAEAPSKEQADEGKTEPSGPVPMPKVLVNLKEITAMGFQENLAKYALVYTNNNLEDAVEAILGGRFAHAANIDATHANEQFEQMIDGAGLRESVDTYLKSLASESGGSDAEDSKASDEPGVPYSSVYPKRMVFLGNRYMWPQPSDDTAHVWSTAGISNRAYPSLDMEQFDRVLGRNRGNAGSEDSSNGISEFIDSSTVFRSSVHALCLKNDCLKGEIEFIGSEMCYETHAQDLRGRLVWVSQEAASVWFQGGVSPQRQRQYKLGDKLNIVDLVNKVCPAEVINLSRDRSSIYIHYIGWSKKWDEWVNIDSTRIQPDIKMGDTLTVLDTFNKECEAVVMDVAIRDNQLKAFIHYKNTSSRWDEWISAQDKRILHLHKVSEAVSEEINAPAQPPFCFAGAVGTIMKVEWARRPGGCSGGDGANPTVPYVLVRFMETNRPLRLMCWFPLQDLLPIPSLSTARDTSPVTPTPDAWRVMSSTQLLFHSWNAASLLDFTISKELSALSATSQDIHRGLTSFALQLVNAAQYALIRGGRPRQTPARPLYATVTAGSASLPPAAFGTAGDWKSDGDSSESSVADETLWALIHAVGPERQAAMNVLTPPNNIRSQALWKRYTRARAIPPSIALSLKSMFRLIVSVGCAQVSDDWLRPVRVQELSSGLPSTGDSGRGGRLSLEYKDGGSDVHSKNAMLLDAAVSSPAAMPTIDRYRSPGQFVLGQLIDALPSMSGPIDEVPSIRSDTRNDAQRRQQLRERDILHMSQLLNLRTSVWRRQLIERVHEAHLRFIGRLGEAWKPCKPGEEQSIDLSSSEEVTDSSATPGTSCSPVEVAGSDYKPVSFVDHGAGRSSTDSGFTSPMLTIGGRPVMNMVSDRDSDSEAHPIQSPVSKPSSLVSSKKIQLQDVLAVEDLAKPAVVGTDSFAPVWLRDAKALLEEYSDRLSGLSKQGAEWQRTIVKTIEPNQTCVMRSVLPDPEDSKQAHGDETAPTDPVDLQLFTVLREEADTPDPREVTVSKPAVPSWFIRFFKDQACTQLLFTLSGDGTLVTSPRSAEASFAAGYGQQLPNDRTPLSANTPFIMPNPVYVRTSRVKASAKTSAKNASKFKKGRTPAPAEDPRRDNWRPLQVAITPMTLPSLEKLIFLSDLLIQVRRSTFPGDYSSLLLCHSLEKVIFSAFETIQSLYVTLDGSDIPPCNITLHLLSALSRLLLCFAFCKQQYFRTSLEWHDRAFAQISFDVIAAEKVYRQCLSRSNDELPSIPCSDSEARRLLSNIRIGGGTKLDRLSMPLSMTALYMMISKTDAASEVPAILRSWWYSPTYVPDVPKCLQGLSTEWIQRGSFLQQLVRHKRDVLLPSAHLHRLVEVVSAAILYETRDGRIEAKLSAMYGSNPIAQEADWRRAVRYYTRTAVSVNVLRSQLTGAVGAASQQLARQLTASSTDLPESPATVGSPERGLPSTPPPHESSPTGSADGDSQGAVQFGMLHPSPPGEPLPSSVLGDSSDTALDTEEESELVNVLDLVLSPFVVPLDERTTDGVVSSTAPRSPDSKDSSEREYPAVEEALRAFDALAGYWSPSGSRVLTRRSRSSEENEQSEGVPALFVTTLPDSLFHAKQLDKYKRLMARTMRGKGCTSALRDRCHSKCPEVASVFDVLMSVRDIHEAEHLSDSWYRHVSSGVRPSEQKDEDENKPKERSGRHEPCYCSTCVATAKNRKNRMRAAFLIDLHSPGVPICLEQYGLPGGTSNALSNMGMVASPLSRYSGQQHHVLGALSGGTSALVKGDSVPLVPPTESIIIPKLRGGVNSWRALSVRSRLVTSTVWSQWLLDMLEPCAFGDISTIGALSGGSSSVGMSVEDTEGSVLSDPSLPVHKVFSFSLLEGGWLYRLIYPYYVERENFFTTIIRRTATPHRKRPEISFTRSADGVKRGESSGNSEEAGQSDGSAGDESDSKIANRADANDENLQGSSEWVINRWTRHVTDLIETESKAQQVAVRQAVTPFQQLCDAFRKQSIHTRPAFLRSVFGDIPWKTFLAGALDRGAAGLPGPFRQAMTEICDGLVRSAQQNFDQASQENKGNRVSSTINSLFIMSPNSRTNTGENRQKLILNPRYCSPQNLLHCRIFGQLLGIACRSSCCLSLDLNEVFWKQLCGAPLVPSDLATFDFSTFRSLQFRDLSSWRRYTRAEFEEYFEMTWSTVLSDGSTHVDLVSNGAQTRVSYDDLDEYARAVCMARLRESYLQITAIREGLWSIIPRESLALFTWDDLEVRVCGQKTVDLKMLKEHTVYRPSTITAQSQIIKDFWAVLEEFTEEERARFLQFAWARSRLPVSMDTNRMQLNILSFPSQAQADRKLPTTETCFFNVNLPSYSNRDILRQKLKLAMQCCTITS